MQNAAIGSVVGLLGLFVLGCGGGSGSNTDAAASTIDAAASTIDAAASLDAPDVVDAGDVDAVSVDAASVADASPPDATLACIVAIPSDATVESTPQAKETTTGTYWACARTTLSLAAGGSTIFLENRADLIISGGGGNTVWAAGQSSIFITTTGNTIYTDGNATITEGNPGTNTIISSCPAVIFDYTMAPVPGRP